MKKKVENLLAGVQRGRQLEEGFSDRLEGGPRHPVEDGAE
jgi:hypothetical protein